MFVILDVVIVISINFVLDMSIYLVFILILCFICLVDGNFLLNNNDFKWIFKNSDLNIIEEIGYLLNFFILYNF